MQRRIKFIAGVFIFLLIFFGFRIFLLQILNSEIYAVDSSTQRISEFEFEKPRGNILDKNLIPFTNRNRKITLVLKPVFLRGKEKEIRLICDILNEDSSVIQRKIDTFDTPVFFEVDEEKYEDIKSLNVEGVSSIVSLKRYDENSIAKHIIGYVNKADQHGQSGIEKVYEDVLSLSSSNRLGFVTDAKKDILQGFGYRLFNEEDEDIKLNIALTIDYHIQKIVEDVLNKEEIKGAVVVQDVLNGDIVAISSKPDFDQNNVEEFLENENKPLFNRAFASYNFGSIFKTVIAASAFEEKIFLEEDYFCKGKIDIGGNEFKCNSYDVGGHGQIDFYNAYAQSCNNYFMELGIKLGYKNIISMAERFGFGGNTGIEAQGIEMSNGKLPSIDARYSDGDIANISIGQGDILVNPIQAANCISIIANGGIKNSVNLINYIVDEHGNKIRTLRIDKAERVISKNTADEIKSMMIDVVQDGTGKEANIDKYGGAAGKTGSAETGQIINNEKVVHAWFGGFFPVNEPKYSICVFIEDGKTGGGKAAPIFAQIAEEIMNKQY